MSSKQPAIASADAAGKVILFGEHAVVYQRPAIAIPLQQVRVYVTAYPDQVARITAPDLDYDQNLSATDDDNALAWVIRLACQRLGVDVPAWRFVIHSELPIAAGLGSGAAVSTALIRTLLRGLQRDWPLADVNALVYEIEKMHHGTPSGIDNTVIVYERPVWFVRDTEPETFAVGAPLALLIADTGIPSPTHETVGDVRRGWQAQPDSYERRFDAIGAIVREARDQLEQGHQARLGQLMNENHRWLGELGVSSTTLDRLCQVARDAGAWGAKLSGGGRGGNLVALVPEDKQATIRETLLKAGAVRTWSTTLQPTS